MENDFISHTVSVLWYYCSISSIIRHVYVYKLETDFHICFSQVDFYTSIEREKLAFSCMYIEFFDEVDSKLCVV